MKYLLSFFLFALILSCQSIPTHTIDYMQQESLLNESNDVYVAEVNCGYLLLTLFYFAFEQFDVN